MKIRSILSLITILPSCFKPQASPCFLPPRLISFSDQHPLCTPSHPSSMMQFDPRALLDPKGRSSQPSQLRSPSIPSYDAASGEKAAPKRPISTPNPLEQIYSVEDRSQVSQKRKKIKSESTELDSKKTSNFVAPSSGGPIGAYMREGQSLDMNGPPMAIDLTAGRANFCPQFRQR